jgi:hypothetical protein
MKTFVASLALSVAIGAAQPALARAEPPPAQLALAKRLLKAMGIEAQMDTTYAQMMPLLVHQQIQLIPDFKPAWREPFAEAAVEASKAITPVLMERFAVMHAKAFTTEELTAAVSFYESPIGRSVVSKSEGLTKQMPALVEELGPVMGRDILKRFCGKAPEACGAAEVPLKQSMLERGARAQADAADAAHSR